MKRRRKINGPFVPLPLAILDAPAWRAMDFIARALWIELRRKLRHGGLNNGKIFLSCRDAEKIGANKDTIARRFVELEHYGFLRKTSEGFLGLNGRGIAPHYRFTDLAHGTHPPTRDFEKWDGKPFVYVPRRASRKQTPVLSGRTPRIVLPDIRTAPGEGSVCIVPSDIGGASKCPVPSDISRLPLPTAGEAQIQGSSTVRAPAQAGDAGSSPAPVANLTEIMLEMVEKLSPEVRMLGVGIEAMTTGCSVTAGSLLIPDPAQVWLLPRA